MFSTGVKEYAMWIQFNIVPTCHLCHNRGFNEVLVLGSDLNVDGGCFCVLCFHQKVVRQPLELSIMHLQLGVPISQS